MEKKTKVKYIIVFFDVHVCVDADPEMAKSELGNQKSFGNLIILVNFDTYCDDFWTDFWSSNYRFLDQNTANCFYHGHAYRDRSGPVARASPVSHDVWARSPPAHRTGAALTRANVTGGDRNSLARGIAMGETAEGGWLKFEPSVNEPTRRQPTAVQPTN